MRSAVIPSNQPAMRHPTPPWLIELQYNHKLPGREDHCVSALKPFVSHQLRRAELSQRPPIIQSCSNEVFYSRAPLAGMGTLSRVLIIASLVLISAAFTACEVSSSKDSVPVKGGDASAAATSAPLTTGGVAPFSCSTGQELLPTMLRPSKQSVPNAKTCLQVIYLVQRYMYEPRTQRVCLLIEDKRLSGKCF